MSYTIKTLRRLRADLTSTLHTIILFEEKLDSIQFQLTLMGLPTLPSPPTPPQAHCQKEHLDELHAEMKHVAVYVDELGTRLGCLGSKNSLLDRWFVPLVLGMTKKHKELEERMVNLKEEVDFTMSVWEDAVRFYGLETSE